MCVMYVVPLYHRCMIFISLTTNAFLHWILIHAPSPSPLLAQNESCFPLWTNPSIAKAHPRLGEYSEEAVHEQKEDKAKNCDTEGEHEEREGEEGEEASSVAEKRGVLLLALSIVL